MPMCAVTFEAPEQMQYPSQRFLAPNECRKGAPVSFQCPKEARAVVRARLRPDVA